MSPASGPAANSLQIYCYILPSDARHKSRLSHVNVFFHHYGGQLKTGSSRQLARRQTNIDNNKGKRKLESVQILLRERKTNYCCIPSIVKNNDKEGLKISKLGREKSLAQICRKDLTEGKLEKNKNKNKKQQNNAFCLALIGFSHKIHNIRIENQILILS